MEHPPRLTSVALVFSTRLTQMLIFLGSGRLVFGELGEESPASTDRDFMFSSGTVLLRCYDEEFWNG